MGRRRKLLAQVKVLRLCSNSPAFAAWQSPFHIPVAQMLGRLSLSALRQVVHKAWAVLQAPLVFLQAVSSHQETKKDILQSMTIKVNIDRNILVPQKVIILDLMPITPAASVTDLVNGYFWA